MNKIILLLLLLVYDLYGYSQLNFRPARDTSWFVELKDSTILYSKKLSVRYSLAEGDYLLLDYNKKIPLSEVIRYRSRKGEYIRERGPEETYRLEKNGPRLFIYSRSYYYFDSTGSKEGKDYFLRKGSTGDMQPLTYKNLLDAMADNPVSVRKLQAGRSTMVVAGVIGASSFLVAVAGALSTFRKNSREMDPNQHFKRTVSPFLIAGPVIMIASMTVLLTGAGHMDKAITIYNQ